MVCIELWATGENFLTLKARIGYPWISKKNSRRTHWSQAQFQKGQPTPCKSMHASPLTSGLESFGHKSTPS